MKNMIMLIFCVLLSSTFLPNYAARAESPKTDFDEAEDVGIYFLLDVSGSMRGEKAEDAEKALLDSLTQIKQFYSENKEKKSIWVSISRFNDDVELVTDYNFLEVKDDFAVDVDYGRCGSGTRLGAGLSSVISNIDEQISQNNRVPKRWHLIVLTDGEPNENDYELAKSNLEKLKDRAVGEHPITTTMIAYEMEKDKLDEFSKTTTILQSDSLKISEVMYGLVGNALAEAGGEGNRLGEGSYIHCAVNEKYLKKNPLLPVPNDFSRPEAILPYYLDRNDILYPTKSLGMLNYSEIIYNACHAETSQESMAVCLKKQCEEIHKKGIEELRSK